MFLLDLDGPILNVKEKYFWVYQSILNDLNLGPARSCYDFWELKRSAQPMESILSGLGPDDLTCFQSEWKNRIESPLALQKDSLTPHLHDTLRALKSRAPLSLVTLRHNRSTLLPQLQSFGLLGYFDEILSPTGQDFQLAPHRKDNWKLKVNLVQAAGIFQPGDSGYFIGDMATDLLAGRALGAKTIAVTSGMRTPELLSELAPDFMVQDIFEIPSMLLEPAPLLQQV